MRNKGSDKIVLFTARLKKACGVLLLFLLIGTRLLYAQSKPGLEYQLKAAFLFNFTRFINWPPGSFSSSNAPFIIGIIGNDPFGSYLDEMVEGEKVGGHQIIIQRFHSVSDVNGCQILFIATDDPALMKEAFSAAARKNILTVSDTDSPASRGGAVHFYKEENKIKIGINIAAAKAAQLEISSKLLKVAKVNR